jgi:hypothetical protein
MHEIEDLVERSVRTLAATGRPWPELRSRYWNLYEFAAEFDTGFTHFRNMDELLAAHFVYRMPVSAHPDYERHRAWFDDIEEFAFIGEPGPEDDGGYVQPPYLYCDAGSPLWARLVASKRLTGADAEPPEPVDMVKIAVEVARIAEATDDRDLVAMWYRLLPPYLLGALAEARASPGIAELREIVRRTAAMSIPMTYGALRDPSPAELAEAPDLAWWYAI